MADQGFMGAGALSAQAQKHLGYGQMRDGAMVNNKGRVRTPEEIKKLKQQEIRDEKIREAARVKNKTKLDKTIQNKSEEAEFKGENLDPAQTDLENEVGKTEELEKINVFKLKSMAKKKGFTGKEFDKAKLIQFLRSNP